MHKRINSKAKDNCLVFIMIIVFITLFALTTYFSVTGTEVMLGDASINSGSMCGIFSETEIIVTIALVIKFHRKGYIIANVMMGLATLFSLRPMIFEHSLVSLPGITMYIAGFVILFVVYRFLCAIKNNEAELSKMAYTDSLTALPNRRYLGELLEQYIESEEKFAVIFIDIDNFKSINDLMGHNYGDVVLRDVAKRWNGVKKDTDVLARIGGDEFALVIINYDDNDSLYSHVRRYEFTLKEKFQVMDTDFYITASMGIALFPEDSKIAIELLRFADTAMYSAKHDEKQKIAFFNNKQIKKIEVDMLMEKLIHEALSENRFFLNFQPQFTTENKKLRGFECLLRMRDGDGATVLPTNFIRIAEKSPLIISIDKWVFKNSIAIFKPFLAQHANLILSVNVSVKYMYSDSFVTDIKGFLEKYNFPPKNLEIEVTESMFISSVERAAQKLNELKEMGINIALDDFGTGYASLSYLNTLPIDLLKIDKSFIDRISNGSVDNDFVEAIISMGHLLKFDVVSEGVEEQDQLNILKEFHCDYVQGYLWGRPIDTDGVKDIISNSIKVEVPAGTR